MYVTLVNFVFFLSCLLFCYLTVLCVFMCIYAINNDDDDDDDNNNNSSKLPAGPTDGKCPDDMTDCLAG